MARNLSQAEINERVAILRRFREALLKQRERFRAYLATLEEQERNGIPSDTPQMLESHLEMEQTIVREIGTFQQVIEPLALMYREYDPEGASDLPELQQALDRTREEIVHRTAQTKEVLKQELASLRSEIANLRIMQRTHSTFLTPEPTTVDISA